MTRLIRSWRLGTKVLSGVLLVLLLVFTAMIGALFILLSVPVASILLSTVTQHFVEEPSNQFGKRLRRMLPGA